MRRSEVENRQYKGQMTIQRRMEEMNLPGVSHRCD